jgi:tRNA-specific 2-thiouridylase
LIADDASWVSGLAPRPGAYAAKTRYRQADAACGYDAARSVNGDADEDKAFELRFRTPQWAVTPGQSAVLYDAELCLGGGVIARTA